MKLSTFVIAAALAFPIAGVAMAQATPAPAAAVTLVAGEVKKVDKEAGKMTIKHGALANLDMPPMTMVFRVKDPAMLEKVKAGDKINFAAERANGAITVTHLDVVK
jgi:Cu(I)/Ag(I) efflux system protein CusF